MPDFDVTVYYENSNIYPSAEFVLRRDAAKTMADGFGLPFIDAIHEPKTWFKAVRGFSREPERGTRCELCIAFRLDRTFAYAEKNGFSSVATTLSVSRRKDVVQINRIGQALAEKYDLIFLGRDWKKDSGEILSQRRAKDAGIYRQDYCGCVYSLIQKEKSRQTAGPSDATDAETGGSTTR